MFPIRDDNTGRIRTPYVTWALIALNVMVFVFLQGIGTNESFTYAFSTIPQEIRTGTDVAENVTVELGDQRTHPARTHAGQRVRHTADIDVHARRPDAPARQHAVSLDFRRQRRGRSLAHAISGLLSHDRRCRLRWPT